MESDDESVSECESVDALRRCSGCVRLALQCMCGPSCVCRGRHANIRATLQALLSRNAFVVFFSARSVQPPARLSSYHRLAGRAMQPVLVRRPSARWARRASCDCGTTRKEAQLYLSGRWRGR